MVASYEASQRLFNSGITVETVMIWNTASDPPSLHNKTSTGGITRYIPAPDLNELWELLPDGTTLTITRRGNGASDRHCKAMFIQYKNEATIFFINPSDGIIDLLVWLKKKENEPKEKADKLIKRLIDSYCDVESDPDSQLETKTYLNAREEVRNLLIKALEEKK